MKLYSELTLRWRSNLALASNRPHSELLASRYRWLIVLNKVSATWWGTKLLTKLSNSIEFFGATLYDVWECRDVALLALKLYALFCGCVHAGVISHVNRTLQLLDSNIRFVLNCLFSNLSEVKLVRFIVCFGCLTRTQINAEANWLAFSGEKGKSFYHVWRGNLLYTRLRVRVVDTMLLLQAEEISRAGQRVMQYSHDRAKHLWGNLLVYFKIISKRKSCACFKNLVYENINLLTLLFTSVVCWRHFQLAICQEVFLILLSLKRDVAQQNSNVILREIAFWIEVIPKN